MTALANAAKQHRCRATLGNGPKTAACHPRNSRIGKVSPTAPKDKYRPKKPNTSGIDNGEKWSEREDSNLRPPAPEAGALPGCATLRP